MSEDTAQPPENRQLAEEVYNRIMADIDDDLLLENIPGLDEKYAGETPEEHEERMKRYQESYKKFDQEMEKFLIDVHGRSRHTRHEALKKEEQADRREDESVLESLEETFEESGI